MIKLMLVEDDAKLAQLVTEYLQDYEFSVDVVTRGESTIAAIHAVLNEGGKVAFVAVLVDRQEGGREKIEALGYPVVSLFNAQELLEKNARPSQSTDCAVA